MNMANIIVTIGPSSISTNILLNLVKAGADTFRINLSHSNEKSLENYFKILRSVDIKAAIDTQGSQLRVINHTNKTPFKIGQKIILAFEDNINNIKKTNLDSILLNHFDAFKQIDIGDLLRLDFSGLAILVEEIKEEGYFLCSVKCAGDLVRNRAVDVAGKTLELDFLTKFDRKAIKFAMSKGIDVIYASFISSADEFNKLREIVGKDIKIVSKIETEKGISNIVSIAKQSDEILIDRGDLSREISIPLVPIATSKVISICKKLNTPVNIATNVLDSMMTNNLPSPAEISDVYNSLQQGVSGIVLAAEVAIGNQPVQSVALLKHLIRLYELESTEIEGLCNLTKTSNELIGEELLNWI